MAERGERAGTALRQTGKKFAEFGDQVLRHLITEDPSERKIHKKKRRGHSEERFRALRGRADERRGIGRQVHSFSHIKARPLDNEKQEYVYQRYNGNDMNDLIRNRHAHTELQQAGTEREHWSPQLREHYDAPARSATQPRQRESTSDYSPPRRYQVKRGSETVTVGVRIRPLIAETWEKEMEQENRLQECFFAELDRTVLEVDKAGQVCNSWSFDYVFGVNSTTSNIFDTLAVPVIERAMDGFNSTIFAYGQTASGKTFSMFGNEENPGISTRAIYAIFDKVKESKFSEYLIRGSYVELYNEDIKDLLASKLKVSHSSSRGDGAQSESKRADRISGESGAGATRGPDLRLRIAEDPKTGAYVKGAVERVVNRPEQVLDMIKFGEQNRHYATTNMNERSSRSHVIVRLVIKRGFVNTNSGQSLSHRIIEGGIASDSSLWHANPKIPQRVSSLNFVDLAGSEKSKRTGATGSQLREANSINKSLLTLGTVINRLAEENSANNDSGHIPYRDSKLTHLLATSLGGNASTAMLACISAADHNREETQSTLRYSARVKKIVNQARLNEVDNLESFMDSYWVEIEALRRQITEAKLHGESKVDDLKKLKEVEVHKAHLERDKSEKEAAHLRTELVREIKITQAKQSDLQLQIQHHHKVNITGFEELLLKHLGLQSRYEELKAKFSKSTKDILDGTKKTVQRVTEALERQAMRVEELELFRLEEQQEFDVDQRNRETVLLTKEEHIQELIARLGDAPEQQKVLAELAQEQERHILERDKRIILMERAQEDMAELTAKVSDEAKAAREAADAAEARAVAAEARHGASLEEAAGRLLQEARSRVLELESALSLAHEAQIKLEKSHATMAQAHKNSSYEVTQAHEATLIAEQRLGEETVERQRLRNENNMLRGRLKAMSKMGPAAVAAVIGVDENGINEDATQVNEANSSALKAARARSEKLTDRVAELEHENQSLTAISADYRDHASEKLAKYEAQIQTLEERLKATHEQMATGETQQSLELRQQLLALEDRFASETSEWRARYRRLEEDTERRAEAALHKMGENSPSVKELLLDRNNLRDKVAALQEEQAELMADLEKAIGRVNDQDGIIEEFTDECADLTSAIVEQGEDIRILLSENGYLRAHIDRASQVAAAATFTRDKDKSRAWTKEVSDLGASIQSSIADELRGAYDEVRFTHQEVMALKEGMARAQEESVDQSHRMARHLRNFRDDLDEINVVEVRLADLHDQANAVQSAHEKLHEVTLVHENFKKKTSSRIEELEEIAEPAKNIQEVSLKRLPEGYHSHVNPQVASLSESSEKSLKLLREASPKAFVSAVMPEGISVEINSNSVAAELRTFPALEAQLEALVPNTLSEKQFWINYFSHKHAIKLNVAQEAERLASLNPDEAGFIQRRGASAHLRQQFIEAMRESGVHLKLHQGTEASDVVLWLKTPYAFAWSTDLSTFPPSEHFTIPFNDIEKISSGKTSPVLQKGLALWSDPDCCFTIYLCDGATLDFESGSKDENFTFLEGANMLVTASASGIR